MEEYNMLVKPTNFRFMSQMNATNTCVLNMAAIKEAHNYCLIIHKYLHILVEDIYKYKLKRDTEQNSAYKNEDEYMILCDIYAELAFKIEEVVRTHSGCVLQIDTELERIFRMDDEDECIIAFEHNSDFIHETYDLCAKICVNIGRYRLL